jgi:hypothetical protein
MNDLTQDDIKKYLLVASGAAYIIWWYLQQNPEYAKKGIVWSTLALRMILFGAFGYLTIKQMNNLTKDLTTQL